MPVPGGIIPAVQRQGRPARVSRRRGRGTLWCHQRQGTVRTCSGRHHATHRSTRGHHLWHHAWSPHRRPRRHHRGGRLHAWDWVGETQSGSLLGTDCKHYRGGPLGYQGRTGMVRQDEGGRARREGTARVPIGASPIPREPVIGRMGSIRHRLRYYRGSLIVGSLYH
eukprot:COSAG01_NODE_1538_length_9984_cov_92.104097_3_plen_167_part_00